MPPRAGPLRVSLMGHRFLAFWLSSSAVTVLILSSRRDPISSDTRSTKGFAVYGTLVDRQRLEVFCQQFMRGGAMATSMNDAVLMETGMFLISALSVGGGYEIKMAPCGTYTKREKIRSYLIVNLDSLSP